MTTVGWEDIPMGQLGTAVAIVCALAASPPPLWENPYGTGDQCLFCHGAGETPVTHEPACAWRQAAEWVAAMTRQDQRLPDTECEVCHDTYIDLPAHQQAQHARLAGDRSVTLACGCVKGIPGGHLSRWCGQQSVHPECFADPVVRQPDDQQTDVDPGEDT